MASYKAFAKSGGMEEVSEDASAGEAEEGEAGYLRRPLRAVAAGVTRQARGPGACNWG